MSLIFRAIERLRPGAEVVIYDNDYSTAIWHKVEGVPPTEEEINFTIQQIENEDAENKAQKITAKTELLNKLGITEEEAKLLLS